MTSVLIVEDSKMYAHVLSIALRRAGFDPVIARDGAEALALWQSVRPNVVILDLGLPVMDGLEVLKHVERSPGWPTVPVIVLTATSGLKLDEARQHGTASVLLKSAVSLPQIIEGLRQALGATAPVPVIAA
jgi:two-component system, chemotaxis family, chemotaxis protein CheY